VQWKLDDTLRKKNCGARPSHHPAAPFASNIRAARTVPESTRGDYARSAVHDCPAKSFPITRWDQDRHPIVVRDIDQPRNGHSQRSTKTRNPAPGRLSKMWRVSSPIWSRSPACEGLSRDRITHGRTFAQKINLSQLERPIAGALSIFRLQDGPQPRQEQNEYQKHQDLTSV
jgi:hypothetical protein